MWQKGTSDGFKNFSTKPIRNVSLTGMTHPKANLGVRGNEKQHYTAVHGIGSGTQAPLSTFRNGAGL
jgi:hypothetical protein